MRWRYYIPHVWESPEVRRKWEDVYLKSEEAPDGESMWLTLDAGMTDEAIEDKIAYWRRKDPSYASDERSGQWIPAGSWSFMVFPNLDVSVPREDFDRHDLLDAVQAFVIHVVGDPSPELIAGTREDFLGSNEHMEQVARADALAGSLGSAEAGPTSEGPGLEKGGEDERKSPGAQERRAESQCRNDGGLDALSAGDVLLVAKKLRAFIEAGTPRERSDQIKALDGGYRGVSSLLITSMCFDPREDPRAAGIGRLIIRKAYGLMEVLQNEMRNDESPKVQHHLTLMQNALNRRLVRIRRESTEAADGSCLRTAGSDGVAPASGRPAFDPPRSGTG